MWHTLLLTSLDKAGGQWAERALGISDIAEEAFWDWQLHCTTKI